MAHQHQLYQNITESLKRKNWTPNTKPRCDRDKWDQEHERMSDTEHPRIQGTPLRRSNWVERHNHICKKWSEKPRDKNKSLNKIEERQIYDSSSPKMNPNRSIRTSRMQRGIRKRRVLWGPQHHCRRMQAGIPTVHYGSNGWHERSRIRIL